MLDVVHRGKGVIGTWRGRVGRDLGSLNRHARYGLATLGPVSIAGSQFLLSLRLLHVLSQASFGSFSFLLIASNLSTGLWSALFCAPLPVLLGERDENARSMMLRCLLSANLYASLLAFAIFCAIGVSLKVDLVPSLLFAGCGALMLLRWFGRAYAYMHGTQWRTVASDLTYGLSLLAAVAVLHFVRAPSLSFAYSGMLAAAIFSLLPFGGVYLTRQFAQFSPRDASRYVHVWRVHSSWSLIGVLTTEATANAHAYIVTLACGPATFARIAASALLIRPIAVAMNALADFERPRLALEVINGSKQAVFGPVRFFRYALMAVWAGTAILSALLAEFAPRLVFPASYHMNDIIEGGILWLAIAGVRLIRTPESTLLQSVGRFRPLAYASVASSGVSVGAVILFLVLGGPLLSIAGILLGEAVFLYFVWRQVRSWLRAGPEEDPPSPVSGPEQEGVG